MCTFKSLKLKTDIKIVLELLTFMDIKLCAVCIDGWCIWVVIDCLVGMRCLRWSCKVVRWLRWLVLRLGCGGWLVGGCVGCLRWWLGVGVGRSMARYGWFW